MPEVAQRHLTLRQQKPSDGLATHNFFFPVLQSNTIQRRVAESVIAKLEAIVQPHFESTDSLIDLAEFVELPFIDKTNSWNLLIAKNREQFGRHLRDFSSSFRISACCRKVVDRDCDLALRRGLCPNWYNSREQGDN